MEGQWKIKWKRGLYGGVLGNGKEKWKLLKWGESNPSILAKAEASLGKGFCDFVQDYATIRGNEMGNSVILELLRDPKYLLPWG